MPQPFSFVCFTRRLRLQLVELFSNLRNNNFMSLTSFVRSFLCRLPRKSLIIFYVNFELNKFCGATVNEDVAKVSDGRIVSRAEEHHILQAHKLPIYHKQLVISTKHRITTSHEHYRESAFIITCY